MRGPLRAARGSIAPVSVVGLTLLCLLLSALTQSAWNGGGAAGRTWPPVTALWGLDATDADLASLPPQPAGVREHHAPPMWPLPRAARAGAADRPAPPARAVPAEPIRDPQQLAHRAAGSRSPPAS
ncbi:hypothetical protein [Spongiactinospora sp. TRM90649]|uniref:hypothetical protein n=1 Tax=Spongiactinospora sp. TRM90649 TaxID=3031114 RepID=UPI0023F812EB|nr:hypothetical protein [Spongiactinospora sp. TRM90649]MDF5758013.1 hypothetical protein [Spongiactinospora sp. TRM90649]